MPKAQANKPAAGAKAEKPKAKAAKPAAAVKPEVGVEPIEHKHADLSPEDRKKVAKLKAAGIALDGTEDSDALDAKLAAIESSGPQEADEEDPDCPDKITPRFEVVRVDKKDRKFPIHFVFTNAGKSALYNERGQRISGVVPAGSPEASTLSKNAARNNALRRDAMRPSDYLP